MLMVADWAALIQANQKLTYSALKRNAEILASAQQTVMRQLAEGVNTPLAAAFGGGNQTGAPISERRTASVVIKFPNRRVAPERTLPASDAEVKLSALIVS